LESVGLIALDTRLGVMDNPEASKINQLIKQIFQKTFEYDIQPSVWRYYKTKGFKDVMKLYEQTALEIQQYVLDAVERFEKNPTPAGHEAGVLEKLIKIDKAIGMAMGEDMLLVGVDTTSTALTSVLYALATNVDKQEILREEVLQILPEKNSKLASNSLNNAPYLRAVLKEAQRLYPTINGNVRAAAQDMVLQGYQIPKGVRKMNI
jgi:cytochrome P450 family 12